MKKKNVYDKYEAEFPQLETKIFDNKIIEHRFGITFGRLFEGKQ